MDVPKNCFDSGVRVRRISLLACLLGSRLVGMGRSCSVCGHSERSQIDKEIIAGIAYRDISGRFQLSKSAVERHANGCIAAVVSRSRELVDQVTAETLAGELRTLRETTLGVLEEARSSSDHNLALKAIARLEAQAELCAKLLGELVERQRVESIDVTVTERWTRIRGVILVALEPFPEARAALLLALEHADC